MKDKGLRALIVDRRHEHDPYGMVTETDIVYKVAAYGHDPKKMLFQIGKSMLSLSIPMQDKMK